MSSRKKDLFTVIISHYKQKDYIYTAIDSVLHQNYPRIELMIYDDASDFPKKEIQQYIEHKKNNNLESVKFVLNKENLGTIKSLNKTIKQATGAYLLFFAADDRLSSNSVLTQLEDCFQKHTDYDVVTAQCMMYDNKLEEAIGDYVDRQIALGMNEKTALDQYKLLCTRCLYSAGATAYRTKIFSKTGYISEEYRLVEDLSYWLKITRMGYKIWYEDFHVLDHRDGGVSKSDHLKVLPPSVIMYYRDIVKINQNEVLQYLNYFTYQEKCKVINNYFNIIYAYGKYLEEMEPEIQKSIKRLKYQVPRYFISNVIKKGKNQVRLFLKKALYYVKKYFYLLIWFILNCFTFHVSKIYESNIYFSATIVLNLFIAVLLTLLFKVMVIKIKNHRGGK